jgi:hypothetical protein
MGSFYVHVSRHYKRTPIMKKILTLPTLLLLALTAYSGGSQETQSPDSSPYSGLFTRGEFKTDYTNYADFSGEIISGGVGRDGIPAIDNPRFNSTAESQELLSAEEPVLVISLDGSAKIYPLRILMWHEIVNDTVADTPVAVTYCPLCNTGIGFNRSVGDRTLTFGTTGRLRYSNLIMYDRQTETWWQQATGRGLIGELAGTELTLIPVLTVSWEDAAESYPEADVLSQETGYNRPYGQNPYSGYDSPESTPFLYRGPASPDEHRPLERVLTVTIKDTTRVYPYAALEQQGVINDQVAGEPVAVFWREGTASALDTPAIETGRDIGSANAFRPVSDGENLVFMLNDQGEIIDTETRSRWNILGEAVAGPLKGTTLPPLPGIQHFWFSAYAFSPEGTLFE